MNMGKRVRERHNCSKFCLRYMYNQVLTTMLNGAAKVLTEIVAQDHPTTRTRFEPLTRKSVRTRIPEKTPAFREASSLKVWFCT